MGCWHTDITADQHGLKDRDLDFTEDGPGHDDDDQHYGFWLFCIAANMASDMGGYHHIVGGGDGYDDK